MENMIRFSKQHSLLVSHYRLAKGHNNTTDWWVRFYFTLLDYFVEKYTELADMIIRHWYGMDT